MATRWRDKAAPGRILVCPGCRARLDGLFGFESRGSIDIKGIGLQETWYLLAVDAGAAPDVLTPSDHLRTRNAS